LKAGTDKTEMNGMESYLNNVKESDIIHNRFTDVQIAIIKKMDEKFKVLGNFYQKHFDKMNKSERVRFGNWFHKILEIYSIFVNKHITNDDFLMFRIDWIMKTEPIALIDVSRRSKFMK
jgi:succinate dehydrogenase flavin-adding protein (antitoxin of CptAB toxin-antitoxin module)